MMGRTGARWALRLLVVSVVVGAAGFGRAADKSTQCVAAKLTAASKYAACRLKADAKAAKTGGSADYSKCNTKFVKAFDRAEAKAGAGICPREGNGPAVSGCLDRVTSECTQEVSGCDGSGSCQTCQECAQAEGGPCFDEVNACLGDPDCSAFIDCLNTCGTDQTCVDQCAATFPNGASLYAAAVVCVVCDTCPGDCNGPGSGCP
jgi:hypothetical protein